MGRRPYGKFYRASFLSFPVIFTFAATLLTVIARPVRLFTTPYTDPSGRLRILSSTPSVTGHIVVAENYIHGFRFLRADHSLLGGVWIGNDKIIKMDNEIEVSRDKDGVKLGDSIYSTFMIQGAVVLQERENAQKNALVMYGQFFCYCRGSWSGKCINVIIEWTVALELELLRRLSCSTGY